MSRITLKLLGGVLYLLCTTNTIAQALEPDRKIIREYRVTAAREDTAAYLASDERSAWPAGRNADGAEQFDVFATEGFIKDTIALGYFRADYQPLVKKPRPGGPRRPAMCNVPTPSQASSNYLWSYAEITQFAQRIGRPPLFPTGVQPIKTITIGLSEVQRQAIVATRFGGKPILGAGTPTVYIVATQHAREWGAAGTAVGLMKELEKTLSSPSYRPTLFAALQEASVVIVPVANPDGYEHTRNIDRDWRGNRNTWACPTNGVNLNRNHEATWGVPASQTSFACDTNYTGRLPASESETRAISGLLDGFSFERQQQPVLVLDYHNYSDLVVYPSGFKAFTDSFGPACDFAKANCHGADFQALRELLGNTTSHRFSPPLFVDDAFSPPAAFRRDQAPNILYSSSGTLIDEAMYSTRRSTRSLAATIELFPTDIGFYVECEPNPDAVVQAAVQRQLDVIERVAVAAPGLVETYPYRAYLPMSIGALASGVIARDYATSMPPDDVRPAMLKPGWIEQTRSTALTGWVNGQSVKFNPLRSAAQYELFTGDVTSATKHRLCLPCEVKYGLPGVDVGNSDMTPQCKGCVDLCDPTRLRHSGWDLKSGQRGPMQKHDCWWTPTAASGELEVGGYAKPLSATHCTFSFSYQNPTGRALGPDAFTVERETPHGTMEKIWADRETRPYYGNSPGARQTTLVFEASELFGVRSVPRFVLRANSASAQSAGIMVFDPVVYCRIGTTP